MLAGRQLREFIDDLLTGAAKPTHHSGVATPRRPPLLGLADREGERAVDPLLGLRSPKLDTPVVEPLTDDQLRAMLKACRGPELRDKRDEAFLWGLMFTSGARRVLALQTTDLGLRADPATVTIRRGKGGAGRNVPLAVEAAVAIDPLTPGPTRSPAGRHACALDGGPRQGFGYDALSEGGPTRNARDVWLS